MADRKHFAARPFEKTIPQLTVTGTDAEGRYIGTLTMRNVTQEPVWSDRAGYHWALVSETYELRILDDPDELQQISHRVIREIITQEIVSEVLGRAGVNADPIIVTNMLQHYHDACRKTLQDRAALPGEAVEIFQAVLAALIELCGGGKVPTAQEDRETP